MEERPDKIQQSERKRQGRKARRKVRRKTWKKIKALVFNGDKCILYLLRNLIEGDPLTVFAEVAFIEDIAVFFRNEKDVPAERLVENRYCRFRKF